MGRLPATSGGVDFQAYYDNQLDITWAQNAEMVPMAAASRSLTLHFLSGLFVMVMLVLCQYQLRYGYSGPACLD